MINTEVTCPYCGELKIGEMMQSNEETPIATCEPCFGLAMGDSIRILEGFKKLIDPDYTSVWLERFKQLTNPLNKQK